MIMEKAKESDLKEIEKILSASFKKFNLDQFYQKYDRESVMSNIKSYLNNSLFEIFKCVSETGKILGVSILIKFPQLFNNNILQIQDVGLQPDPRLSKNIQSRVLIRLIRHLVDYAKRVNAKVASIIISPNFNIGKYLIKNGFINSDITYIKEVV